MSQRKEYKILPQSERDRNGYINGGNRPDRNCSCCLISLATASIFLILVGTAALTIGIFYSQEFTQVFNQFWAHRGENYTGNDFDGLTLPIFSTSSSTSDPTTPERSTQAPTTNSTSDEDSEFDGNSTLSSNSTSFDSSKEMEEFAEFVKNFEKYMETVTGIKRAEFVVPLFMLICFLVSLTMVSLCCCILMKRRETQRRKILGKIITDLQTGDSKTVLLNDEGDD